MPAACINGSVSNAHAPVERPFQDDARQFVRGDPEW
jgi:hypothetical protein